MSLDVIKDYITKQLTFARDSFVSDIEAIPEDDILNGMAGSERKPVDFCYEVSYVNRRFVKRLTNQPVEEWPVKEGWMVAPQELRSKPAILSAVRDATDEFIAAWKAVPAEEMSRVIEVPNGETSPLDLAFSVCWHNGYHDAQLNYIQELKGDMAMHWQD